VIKLSARGFAPAAWQQVAMVTETLPGGGRVPNVAVKCLVIYNYIAGLVLPVALLLSYQLFQGGLLGVTPSCLTLKNFFWINCNFLI